MTHDTAVVRQAGVRGYQGRPFQRTHGRATSWYSKCSCGWYGPTRSTRREAAGEADAHAHGGGPNQH